jgi:hypothetical protein
MMKCELISVTPKDGNREEKCMTNQMLFYTIDRILKVTVICLLLLLIGFEMVPINSIRDTQQYIVNAGFQRARSQMLERYAFALQYGPAAEKAQARSTLQNLCVLFQSEQAALLTNPDLDIQFLLQAAQTDYLSIVAAVHVLIMYPNTPIEVDILVLHDQNFFSKMDAVVQLLEQHLETRNAQLLSIRVLMIGVGSVCQCFVIFLLLVHIRQQTRIKKKS